MNKLIVNTDGVMDFLKQDEIDSFYERVGDINHSMWQRTGKGSDFLGWLDLPSRISETEIEDIKETARKIRENSEAVIVIGIGGSYLGARAVIEALSGYFDSYEKGNPEIIYAGNNISEDYLSELTGVLDIKDYSIIVISKSGTTTEPAIAFRILRQHIEKKYGNAEAKERIIAITDAEKGALKKLSGTEGYKTFVIPGDVGGRFSVLTPVGLLPIAAAGIDIETLIRGAKDMQELLSGDNMEVMENPANLYAVVRNLLYGKGRVIEVLAGYLPRLEYMIEWWKQLYGESEGKEGKGIFPAGVVFTTDLHSMGQMIQDGVRNVFETVISVENERNELTIPEDKENLDGLNFIAGKGLNDINHKAELGTRMAHIQGGVPNLVIGLPELNEYYTGELIYFFEKACAVSGYLLGVNPFDQPGVEAYKRNMFALLEKPGYEKETEEIKKKLKK